MDKYVGYYMEKNVKCVPSEKKCALSLKTIYLDYKKFLLQQHLQPLRYTEFRQEFIKILDLISNKAPSGLCPSREIKVEQWKNRWIVRNVHLVADITPQKLFDALYS